jgi:hypothetical protein
LNPHPINRGPPCHKKSPNFFILFYLKHHAINRQDLRNTKKSNPSMGKHV